MSTRVEAIAFDPAPRDWVAPLGVGVLAAALVDGDGDGVLDVVVLTSRGVEPEIVHAIANAMKPHFDFRHARAGRSHVRASQLRWNTAAP